MVPAVAFTRLNVPVVVLFNVMRLPTVPDTCHVLTVTVDPAVKRSEWAAVPSSLMSAKIVLPIIVLEAVLVPLENQRLLNVRESPENEIAVLEVSVILVVPASVNVSPVVVAVFQTVPVPVRVQRPVPLAIVLVVLPFPTKTPTVTL